MKKIIVLVVVITILMVGCKPSEYTFPNKNQSIEKIEMLDNPNANENTLDAPMYNICTLEGEDAELFMNSLYSIKTSHCITPPPTDYGLFVARVVYQNGDVEMFGSSHIEFVAKGDTPKKIGEYCFDDEEFQKLFFQYAGTPDTWEHVVP